MKTMLCTIIEMAILFPGATLAYLPMRHKLRFSLTKLLATGIPGILGICILGSAISSHFGIPVRWMMIPEALLASIYYCCSLNIPIWKSGSVALAVCSVFSCLSGVARSIDAFLHPDYSLLWLSIPAGIAFHLMCWVFVAFAAYPATHGVADLLDDEYIASTWYVFWVLPLLFICVCLYIIPVHTEILYMGRMMKIYIIISLVLLALLSMFYLLFYLMAKNLDKLDSLRQENQFLHMQENQWDNLKTTISETKRARHDMRHHLNILRSLAERQEWEKVMDYLSSVQESIPIAELNLCDNPMVDSVVSHYSYLSREADIPFTALLDLPQKLPVAEIDFCVVLSNLLENALEASKHTQVSRRFICVKAKLHSSHVILLLVKNAYDGVIKETDGVFQSSKTKRQGTGIGLQSVHHIAEKNGGYSKFQYENGEFFAHVMLRGNDRKN